jgi:hypothetical protein
VGLRFLKYILTIPNAYLASQKKMPNKYGVNFGFVKYGIIFLKPTTSLKMEETETLTMKTSFHMILLNRVLSLKKIISSCQE